MNPIKSYNTTKIKDTVNFYDLANYFEEKGIVTTYNSIKFVCPYHNEKTASFVYHVEKKVFHCFGCRVSGDVFDYVQHKLGTTNFSVAAEFLLKFTGLGEDGKGEVPSRPSYNKDLRVMQELFGEKEKKEFSSFSEDDIRFMVKARENFFLDRGFTKETLDKFEVGFFSLEKRVIVPIRDQNGDLIGATGRTILPNYKDLEEPKWKHYKNSNINQTLFNIHNAIPESLSRKNGIILCEGPCDAMWLDQNGFPNVGSLLSNGITNHQKGLLLRYFTTIYLCLDGDNGGEVGKSKIYRELKDYFNIYNVAIPEGKDPDDLTREELKALIDGAEKL